MLRMSPYQHYEKMKELYTQFFPSDVVLWDIGIAATAQNTERTRVVYAIDDDDARVESADGGYVGVGKKLWQGPPGPTLRILYHVFPVYIYAKHDVLYDQGDTPEEYVPGLISRVATVFHESVSGPFPSDSTGGIVKLGTQNPKNGIWRHTMQVRVPFAVSDLKGWLAQSGVSVAPIAEIRYEGEIDATQTDDT